MFNQLKKMAGMINFKIEIEMPTELPNQNGEAGGALRLPFDIAAAEGRNGHCRC